MEPPQTRQSRAIANRNWNLTQLPGLNQTDRLQLAKLGIHTTLELLQQGHTPPKRQAIANQLQLHIQHLNKWVALADLSRVPSVGCEYCGLLLHAGISSPLQLAQIPLPRLHQQILKLQVATLQSREHCPSLEQVSQWIQEARVMLRA